MKEKRPVLNCLFLCLISLFIASCSNGSIPNNNNQNKTGSTIKLVYNEWGPNYQGNGPAVDSNLVFEKGKNLYIKFSGISDIDVDSVNLSIVDTSEDAGYWLPITNPNDFSISGVKANEKFEKICSVEITDTPVKITETKIIVVSYTADKEVTLTNCKIKISNNEIPDEDDSSDGEGEDGNNQGGNTAEKINDNFVYVEGGLFEMGSYATHSVYVSDFYMSPYEVTQSEFKKYCSSTYPFSSSFYRYGEGDNNPMFFVTWYESIIYCNKKSIAEGLKPCYSIKGSVNPSDWGDIPDYYDSDWDKVVCDFSASGYRLPTEAEWEYAAKGGKNKDSYKYSGSNDMDEVAWYDENSEHKSHPVGQKKPNSLGIYDLSGNIAELCWDWYKDTIDTVTFNPTGPEKGSYRVMRGGHWQTSGSGNLEITLRNCFLPYSYHYWHGFRVVRSAPKSYCSVTYVTEHGNKPETKWIEKGKALTSDLLPVLEEKGYKFSGWYSDSELTQMVSSDSSITENINVYAKWEKTGESGGEGGNLDGSDSESKPETDFIYVRGGTFSMGDPDDDFLNPIHDVTVSSFYMSPYELTQKEYEKYCSYSGVAPNNITGKGDKYPVFNVSWYDAIVYCNKRSIKEGLTPCYTIEGSTDPSDWGDIPSSRNKTWDSVTCNFKVNGYRLPTEAEWEYAARGGKYQDEYRYSGSDTIDDVAWYNDINDYYTSPTTTYETGSKDSNSLGIYDMSGNVCELCWDWYDSYTGEAQTDPKGPEAVALSRVRRGGSYYYGENYSEVWTRDRYEPHIGCVYMGFRLVRSQR